MTGNDDETNLLTPLELRQKKYSKRRKLTKKRESETLAKLEAFQSQIRKSSKTAAKKPPAQTILPLPPRCHHKAAAASSSSSSAATMSVLH